MCCAVGVVLCFKCPVPCECVCFVLVMLAGMRKRWVGWLGFKGGGKAETGSVQAGAELNRTAVARERVLYILEGQEIGDVKGQESGAVGFVAG